MGLFNRKKKRKRDEFLRLLGDALKDANENVQTVGKAIFDSQEPNRSDFGRCKAHPIFTRSLAGTESYFSRLCTKNGSKFTWSGYTSIRATVQGHNDVGEDVYTLYLNGEKYTDIYVVPYVAESKFPPAGLYFCDDDTDWDLEREAFARGLTATQLKEIKEMEEEIENEILEKQKALEEKIAKKSKHINSKYVDFSIDAELQNPEFVFLASLDIDALTVYEYCHREELLFQKVVNGTCDKENQNAELYFNILHDIESKEWQQYRQDKKKSHAELQKEASSRGIDFDAYMSIYKMEAENAEIMWKLRVKELRGIAKQAMEVQINFSKFDLGVEWMKPTFRSITEKRNMLVAYEVIHFDECYAQTPKEWSPGIYEEKTEPQLEQYDEKLFCCKCGAELPDRSAFCNRCGAKVEPTPIYNDPPIYIDSLFSVEKDHVGKYVQLIGNYSGLLTKKEPLKCNISQYSMRGETSIDVELIEPLPDYVVNTTVFDRQPIILRGILDKSTERYYEYVLKNAEYQGYWRDKTGKIRCMEHSCEHKCSKDCPIYLNKLGKEKYDEYNRDEAIELFKRAVFLTPDFAEAWRNLGFAYLDFQKYTDAYESFCESEEYGPNNERTMYGEIVSLSKVGRQKDAQDLLEKYQKLFPNKDSGTLSSIIIGNLSKSKLKPRLTDDEYADLLAKKGFHEFWKTLVEEKERTFATQSCNYTGRTYRRRCEDLKWLVSVHVGRNGEGLLDFRKALVDANVQDANSMLLFDAIDEYESRFVRY